MRDAADSAAESREQFMRVALQMAERGMAAGGPPVGACLVRNGEVIAAAHNSVIGELDVTAHAEIAVIREACKSQRALNLHGASLYVTLEPCVMCLGACFYAGIDEIIFGAPISAMHVKTSDELGADTTELFAATDNAPVVNGGLLEAECVALVERWQPLSGTGQR